MTNFEGIKNLSLEELARFNIRYFCYMNGYRSDSEWHTSDDSIFNSAEEALEYETKWLQKDLDQEVFDVIKNRKKK